MIVDFVNRKINNKMSVETTTKTVTEESPVSVVDTTIRIPGYDGPSSGNTRSTKTQRGSTTESNLETYTKTTQVHRTCRGIKNTLFFFGFQCFWFGFKVRFQ